VRREWLVRLHLQRVAVPVQVIVDVSRSMHFGGVRRKLDVVADFVEALGVSAFRSGDRVGMTAFDLGEREDLYVPPRHGRGSGDAMAALLRNAQPAPAGTAAVERSGKGSKGHGPHGGHGLMQAVSKLAGRHGLVFIASDFHWPLDAMPAILDMLVHAHVVPMVIWDAAELAPPTSGALLAVHDVESGARRTLWLSERVRAQWREAVVRRRAELASLFGKRGMRPFYVEGAFDGEALSRYFLEQA
jgi:uncharacterized protein (DUF58 family)